ncbi:DNA alkylation repair protein [Candidatus Woesearchaeota archaeon]|nr:DNA alkylation repair protein [Candidatus Woesearchaeota archaeon]
MLGQLKRDLEKLSNKEKANILRRFFKTGKGEYGEGDIFLGINVPVQRKVAKQYSDLSLAELQSLLDSKIHDHRMVALFILIDKLKKANEKEIKEIFDFYLKNTRNINNWDLVDLSARDIIGELLQDKDRRIIYELAKSNNLWEKRISIISTYAFIRKNDFKDTLKVSEILLKDKHDLIHKAVGWMLREVGKRNQDIEEEFLNKYHKEMPRTMLRYAIERFPDEKKRVYMGK